MHDDKKIELRPILGLDIIAEDTPINKFQNITLRPILKLQNEALLGLTQIYIPKLASIALEKERRTYLKDFFNKNPQLNYLFIGTIIGIMTADELAFYGVNKNEVNKRVKEMMIIRICTNK